MAHLTYAYSNARARLAVRLPVCIGALDSYAYPIQESTAALVVELFPNEPDTVLSNLDRYPEAQFTCVGGSRVGGSQLSGGSRVEDNHLSYGARIGGSHVSLCARSGVGICRMARVMLLAVGTWTASWRGWNAPRTAATAAAAAAAVCRYAFAYAGLCISECTGGGGGGMGGSSNARDARMADLLRQCAAPRELGYVFVAWRANWGLGLSYGANFGLHLPYGRLRGAQVRHARVGEDAPDVRAAGDLHARTVGRIGDCIREWDARPGFAFAYCGAHERLHSRMGPLRYIGLLCRLHPNRVYDYVSTHDAYPLQVTVWRYAFPYARPLGLTDMCRMRRRVGAGDARAD